MRIEFDEGTLLLRDAPDTVPYAEWDNRVDEYRTQAYRYRSLLEWAGAWTEGTEQATLQNGFIQSVEDAARAYPNLDLTPAVHIEPRDYQQAALDAWIDHGRHPVLHLQSGNRSGDRRCRGRRAGGINPFPEISDQLFREGQVTVIPTSHLRGEKEYLVVLSILSYIIENKIDDFEVDPAVKRTPMLVTVDEAHNYYRRRHPETDQYQRLPPS